MIREDLSKSLVLTRGFIRANFEKDPLKILRQECWGTLLKIEAIFIREQNECISALQSIDWKSAELESIISKFRCLKYSSSLLIPSNYDGESLDDIVLSCKPCGEESDFADIAEPYLEEHLSYEFYRIRKDGTDDSLYHCLECFRKSYITDEDKCALCGHTRSFTECNRCGADLRMLEQDLGRLCGYCHHIYTRILAE